MLHAKFYTFNFIELSVSSKWLLTFVEAGIGPSLQQQFGQVIICHTDGTHQWSPFKVQPHLHIQTCPQTTTTSSVNKLHPYLITYIANMDPTEYIYSTQANKIKTWCPYNKIGN